MDNNAEKNWQGDIPGVWSPETAYWLPEEETSTSASANSSSSTSESSTSTSVNSSSSASETSPVAAKENDPSASYQAGYDAFFREQKALDDYADGYEKARKEYEASHPSTSDQNNSNTNNSSSSSNSSNNTSSEANKNGSNSTNNNNDSNNNNSSNQNSNTNQNTNSSNTNNSSSTNNSNGLGASTVKDENNTSAYDEDKFAGSGTAPSKDTEYTGGSGTAPSKGTDAPGSGSSSSKGTPVSNPNPITPENAKLSIAEAQKEWGLIDEKLKAGKIDEREAAVQKAYWHARAEAARSLEGFSGGVDGSKHIDLEGDFASTLLNSTDYVGGDKKTAEGRLNEASIMLEVVKKLQADGVLSEAEASKLTSHWTAKADEVLEELGLPTSKDRIVVQSSSDSTSDNDTFVLDVEKASRILKVIDGDFTKLVQDINTMVSALNELQANFYSPSDKDTTLIYQECEKNIGVGTNSGLYPAMLGAFQWCSAVDQYIQSVEGNSSKGNVYDN